MSRFLKLKFVVSLFPLLIVANLEAGDTSGSSNYRERFSKAPTPEREEPAANGEEDGGDGGGGSKGGKSRKKKKKKDDVRRVVGPRDPIVPVTGVETGDLTAVTYKSPTPTAPLLEKSWNSTAWAPTYQPASRSFFGDTGLQSVVQSDLIEHTGWKVDGDSISISPDLNGGPYDVETGQPITFTVDRETSVDFLGMPGRVVSGLTWDNPFSVFGPYNPFLLVRKNPLKNPLGIVQSGRRLANHAGVLSAWAFEEGGVQIAEDGSIGIIHDPSGGEALWAGAGIALWFTPVKAFRPVLSAGARALPRAAQAWGAATALGRGAWGRVSGFSQRAWGQVSGLSQRAWGRAGQAWQGTNDFLRSLGLGSPGPAYSGIPVDLIFRVAGRLFRGPRARQLQDEGFEVDDIVNEAYLALSRRAINWGAIRNPVAFISRQVNFVIEGLRRTQAARPVNQGLDSIVDTITHTALSIGRHLTRRDQLALRFFREAYASADDATRKIVDYYVYRLTYFASTQSKTAGANKSYRQFVDEMGMSANAVKKRWWRFKDDLIQRVEEALKQADP